MDHISMAKLSMYFSVTAKALAKAKKAGKAKGHEKEAQEVIDMAERYHSDAQYFFKEKNDSVTAFAALNYAHGWLDAGARLGLYHVKDSKLFVVK